MTSKGKNKRPGGDGEKEKEKPQKGHQKGGKVCDQPRCPTGQRKRPLKNKGKRKTGPDKVIKRPKRREIQEGLGKGDGKTFSSHSDKLHAVMAQGGEKEGVNTRAAGNKINFEKGKRWPRCGKMGRQGKKQGGRWAPEREEVREASTGGSNGAQPGHKSAGGWDLREGMGRGPDEDQSKPLD